MKNAVERILHTERRFSRMKKSRLALIIGLLALILIVGLFYWAAPIYKADQVKSLTMITLPSPPQYKTVTDQKDIEVCLDYLDSLDLAPAINFGKGWWFMIKIDSNTTISFIGEYVSFNGRTFKVKNPDYEDTLRALYQSMNYDEKAW